MNQSRKKFYTVSGVIIAVLLVVLLWARNAANYPSGWGTPTSSPTTSAMATKTPRPAVRTTPGSSAMPQSYDMAVQQYSGHRIQFDMYCQANPVQLSVANGTTVMLDNRSGDARTIRVGGVAYALAGYGWKIVTLSSKTLPATLGLDCGSGRNVGTIIVQ